MSSLLSSEGPDEDSSTVVTEQEDLTLLRDVSSDYAIETGFEIKNSSSSGMVTHTVEQTHPGCEVKSITEANSEHKEDLNHSDRDKVDDHDVESEIDSDIDSDSDLEEELTEQPVVLQEKEPEIKKRLSTKKSSHLLFTVQYDDGVIAIDGISNASKDDADKQGAKDAVTISYAPFIGVQHEQQHMDEEAHTPHRQLETAESDELLLTSSTLALTEEEVTETVPLENDNNEDDGNFQDVDSADVSDSEPFQEMQTNDENKQQKQRKTSGSYEDEEVDEEELSTEQDDRPIIKKQFSHGHAETYYSSDSEVDSQSNPDPSDSSTEWKSNVSSESNSGTPRYSLLPQQHHQPPSASRFNVGGRASKSQISSPPSPTFLSLYHPETIERSIETCSAVSTPMSDTPTIHVDTDVLPPIPLSASALKSVLVPSSEIKDKVDKAPQSEPHCDEIEIRGKESEPECQGSHVIKEIIESTEVATSATTAEQIETMVSATNVTETLEAITTTEMDATITLTVTEPCVMTNNVSEDAHDVEGLAKDLKETLEIIDTKTFPTADNGSDKKEEMIKMIKIVVSSSSSDEDQKMEVIDSRGSESISDADSDSDSDCASAAVVIENEDDLFGDSEEITTSGADSSNKSLPAVVNTTISSSSNKTVTSITPSLLSSSNSFYGTNTTLASLATPPFVTATVDATPAAGIQDKTIQSYIQSTSMHSSSALAKKRSFKSPSSVFKVESASTNSAVPAPSSSTSSTSSTSTPSSSVHGNHVVPNIKTSSYELDEDGLLRTSSLREIFSDLARSRNISIETDSETNEEMPPLTAGALNTGMMSEDNPNHVATDRSIAMSPTTFSQEIEAPSAKYASPAGGLLPPHSVGSSPTRNLNGRKSLSPANSMRLSKGTSSSSPNNINSNSIRSSLIVSSGMIEPSSQTSNIKDGFQSPSSSFVVQQLPVTPVTELKQIRMNAMQRSNSSTPNNLMFDDENSIGSSGTTISRKSSRSNVSVTGGTSSRLHNARDNNGMMLSKCASPVMILEGSEELMIDDHSSHSMVEISMNMQLVSGSGSGTGSRIDEQDAQYQQLNRQADNTTGAMMNKAVKGPSKLPVPTRPPPKPKASVSPVPTPAVNSSTTAKGRHLLKGEKDKEMKGTGKFGATSISRRDSMKTQPSSTQDQINTNATDSAGAVDMNNNLVSSSSETKKTRTSGSNAMKSPSPPKKRPVTKPIAGSFSYMKDTNASTAHRAKSPTEPPTSTTSPTKPLVTPFRAGNSTLNRSSITSRPGAGPAGASTTSPMRGMVTNKSISSSLTSPTAASSSKQRSSSSSSLGPDALRSPENNTNSGAGVASTSRSRSAGFTGSTAASRAAVFTPSPVRERGRAPIKSTTTTSSTSNKTATTAVRRSSSLPPPSSSGASVMSMPSMRSSSSSSAQRNQNKLLPPSSTTTNTSNNAVNSSTSSVNSSFSRSASGRVTAAPKVDSHNYNSRTSPNRLVSTRSTSAGNTSSLVGIQRRHSLDGMVLSERSSKSPHLLPTVIEEEQQNRDGHFKPMTKKSLSMTSSTSSPPVSTGRQSPVSLSPSRGGPTIVRNMLKSSSSDETKLPVSMTIPLVNENPWGGIGGPGSGQGSGTSVGLNSLSASSIDVGDIIQKKKKSMAAAAATTTQGVSVIGKRTKLMLGSR
jgi:hypothetical protein